MAEIVNLRLARKAKLRTERGAIAQEKRPLHGRTAAERTRDAAEKSLREKVLDQAKRDG
jgi:hypothetical protein